MVRLLAWDLRENRLVIKHPFAITPPPAAFLVVEYHYTMEGLKLFSISIRHGRGRGDGLSSALSKGDFRQILRHMGQKIKNI